MNKSASRRLDKERGGSLSAPHLPNKNVFLYSKTPLFSHLTLAIRSRRAVRLHILLHITTLGFICALRDFIIEDILGFGLWFNSREVVWSHLFEVKSDMKKHMNLCNGPLGHCLCTNVAWMLNKVDPKDVLLNKGFSRLNCFLSHTLKTIHSQHQHTTNWMIIFLS